MSEHEPEDVAEQPLLSPLSIQAASLVRSIEALSNIFWISIAGTFLTIFFVGLAQLEENATTDYLYLGEYQVPKSIVPLASLIFAMFAFWLTANRLNMLAFVLESTRLPRDTVHEIFHLNPPILHVFDANNVDRWAPFTGTNVLVINWAVFFGNSLGLIFASALEQTAAFAELDVTLLLLYLLLGVMAIVYGVRSITPSLRGILGVLHGVDFQLGWPRVTGAVLLMIAVAGVGNMDHLFNPSDQPDDLIGPGVANAIDGETLFMRGVQIKLFGIDAVEPDQICQNGQGEDYPCGRAATRSLQELVHDRQVVCFPFFAMSAAKVAATCQLVAGELPPPAKPREFFIDRYQPTNLSRLMVARGHALAVGVGESVFRDDQLRAQATRIGIWQGSFEPPATWRARR